MLGRWTAELAERPEANAAKSAREQLTLIRVFEEFRGHGYDTPTMLYGGTPNDGLTHMLGSETGKSRMEPLQPGSVDLVPTVRMEQRNRPRADSFDKRCHVKPLCQNSIWTLPRPRSTGSDCGH
jgi:hypothetical protein